MRALPILRFTSFSKTSRSNLQANRILQERIGYLLARPVGRPSLDVRRSYANFTYQAGSWTKPRRIVAKVEWHPSELYPRVGFIITNMARPPENVVAFYNKRGTCEQRIKEGKGAIRWTRLSCHSFAANAVRLQLHALAYNLGNFLRTLATPEPIKDWSLTSLKEKLIKIGAKVVRHGRYVAFLLNTPKSVRRNLAAHRRVAAVAHCLDSVRRSRVTRSIANHGRGASCYQKIRRHSARDRATARSATHPQGAITFQACQSV